MSTHVVGFRPPDKKWEKMRKVWESCVEAGVEPPDDVVEFFGDEEPDPAGVEVDLEECGAATEYSAEGRDGYEVDVTKLPKGVSIVRFVNSW